MLISAALAALLQQQTSFADGHGNVEIEKMVVTADPFGDRSEDELINSVTIISHDQLQKRQSTTLGETLDGLSGVANADFGPGVGRPVIRGLSGSRVQTLNNGLRVADVSGEGADHNIAMDTSNASQIEILRGPATLLYGGNASGGVINVISQQFNPEIEQSANINGTLGYGENGNQRLGDIAIAIPISESLSLRGHYAGQRSHDFDIDGFQQIGNTTGDKGTLENSAIDTNTFSLTAMYSQDWGYAALSHSSWRTEYEIPGVVTGVVDDEFGTIKADYDRIDFRSEIYDPFAGFETLRLKLAHTQFDQQEVAALYKDGVFDADESGPEVEFENDETEVRLELVHNPIGAWQGVAGLQYNYRDYDAQSLGEEHEEDEHDEETHGGHGHGDPYVRPNKMRAFGLFLLENRATSFGRVEFAARLDHVDFDPSRLDEDRDIEGTGGFDQVQNAVLKDKSFTPISLSAGALFEVDQAHHLRASLSRSERAPSPEQLYAFGEHHAVKAAEVGDPNLDEETYLNLELGIDRHQGPFTYILTAFYNKVDDYIYLESAKGADGTISRTKKDEGEDEGDPILLNKQRDAKFYGAEFSSAWQIQQGLIPLTLRFSADYVRGKLDKGGNLPRISPARIGLGVDTGYRNIDVSIDYQRVFNQSRKAELETSTDGYDLLSFNANWQPDALKALNFFVKGNNLLDEDGRRHTSFLKDDTTIVGRSIMAGVNFDFSL